MRVPLLWRLAPTTLLRFPRSAAAVAFSAGVVVLATILGPLFLGSSERAAIQGELERRGRWEAGLQIQWRTFSGAPTKEARAALLRLGLEGRAFFEEAAAGAPGIGRPAVSFVGSEAQALTASGTERVRLVHRSGWTDNVTVVERGDGDGVWLPDVTAEALRAQPGDEVTIRTERDRVSVRVGGIYRFLPDEPQRDFWAPLEDVLYKSTSSDTFPPAFVLAPPALVAGSDEFTQVRWDLPLTSEGLPPETVRGAARAFRRITSQTLSRSGRLADAIESAGIFGFDPRIDSLLPGIVDNAQDRLDASQAPASVVTVTTRILGAGLMVAAGLSLVARRRSEVRALIARGLGPGTLALRFLVEGLGPVVGGAVAGVLAGYAGVQALGAGGLEWSYVGGLAADIAIGAASAIALFALSTGAAIVREERSFGARRTAVARAAPLVAAAAVAGCGWWAYSSLDTVAVDRAAGPLRGSILLAPIGVIAAAALAGGVVLRLALPPVASWARQRSPGIFLAAKRLTAGSTMTHTLVVLCGSALGVMFFGLTVAGSVRTTAVAKAKTFVGSDVSMLVAPNPPPLPELDFPATQVTEVSTFVEGTGLALTVLGIDPATFEGAAFWDGELSDEPLGDLVAALQEDGGAAIPVVAVGFGGRQPAITGSATPLDVVGTARAFPGMTAGQPALVMTQDALEGLLEGGSGGSRADQVWAKGPPEEAAAALGRAGLVGADPITVDEVLDVPTLQSLVWSLGLLAGVGALASATAVAGLSLYLQARHAAAQVAAAMTRRMGIRRRDELMSWVAEVGGAGAAAFVVGAATGLGTAAVVHERLDPQPHLLPDPIFVVPYVVVAVTGAGVLAVAGYVSRRLQRRMDAAPVGEIMRV
ncbi:MAG TPA: hypothetical protein VG318_02905 [Actinomycetota bacterium]|nr:hypothetical protein [Actinomycetota bacterium]